MKPLVRAVIAFVATAFRSHLSLQLEIVALRHQLTVYQRAAKRPRIQAGDRLLWSWLSRLWAGWQKVLIFVQPRTVIAWQQRRFRAYGAKLSRGGRPGRPAVCEEVRELIRTLSKANPLWGSPRIVGELRKLGIEMAKSTVEKYRVRVRKPPQFRRRVDSLGSKEVITAPRSPWQNPFVERLIGSIRRDCLDHMIVLNEQHLKRLLVRYFDYYHRWRTHRSLAMDCPEPRVIQLPDLGPVREVPEVGGLHHHYERLAA